MNENPTNREIQKAPGANLIVAFSQLESGRPDEAERLLAAHTRTHPNDAQAWLLRGLAKQELGHSAVARGCYAKALSLVQQGALPTGDDASAERWASLWRNAAERVERDRRILVEGILDRFRQQYGAANLKRVEAALTAHLRKQEPHYPDDRQRPVFLFFPGIRVQPFYDPAEFAWTGFLEQNTCAIQQELLAVMERKRNVELFYDEDRSVYKRLMPDWEAYFFFRYGRRYDQNHSECPTTSEVLARLPLCHIPNFSPETLFSFIAPHGCIKPHRGVSNIRLVVHLPLLIPGPCSLNVGGIVHVWQGGRAVVFDDTFVHEARNDTSSERAVLLLDIWHPDLTGEEKNALTEVISALSDFEPLPDEADAQ